MRILTYFVERKDGFWFRIPVRVMRALGAKAGDRVKVEIVKQLGAGHVLLDILPAKASASSRRKARVRSKAPPTRFKGMKNVILL